jgi:hypothetical protein
MFRVEIDDQDGLMDLVALMARQIGATFEARMVLETANEQLARGVAGLLDKAIEIEPEMGLFQGLSSSRLLEMEPGEKMPELALQVPAAGHGHEPLTATCRYCGKPISDHRAICQSADCKAKAQLDRDERYKPKRQAREHARLAQKEYGQCEFCDLPRLPRSKTCGAAACVNALAKKHQLAYQARQAAKAAQADQPAAAPIVTEPEQPVAEASPASEDPFAGMDRGKKSTAPMYQVDTSKGLKLMTFKELQTEIAAGTVTEGMWVKALPSGRFYTVRAGQLDRVSQEREAGPGPAATR